MWGNWSTHVDLFFTTGGFLFPRFEVPSDGIKTIADLLGWFGQPLPRTTSWTLFLSTGLTIVLITIGLLTRPALLLLLLFFTYYWTLYLHMFNTSFHRLLYVITFILLFSPCAQVWSVGSYLKGKNRDPESKSNVSLWTQRLICIQVIFVYFGTGVFKIMSPAWNNGENVATSLMGDWASPVGFWILQQDFSWGVYDLASLLVILFEIYAVVFIFDPRRQKVVFIIGVAFHGSIAITLNIWQFMIIPLTYILFVEPEKMRSLLFRWSESLSRRRSQ
jgi:hypothetical protein